MKEKLGVSYHRPKPSPVTLWDRVRLAFGQGCLGTGLHICAAIAIFLIWPMDYDYDWFAVTGDFLASHAWNAFLLCGILVTILRKPRQGQLLAANLIFLFLNFMFGVSDEVVNRHYNPGLFLWNRPWSIPDAEGWRWWMKFDEYLPLIAIVVIASCLWLSQRLAIRKRLAPAK